MGNIFGEKKTMKQIIREQKRNLDRSIRTLDRERASLERDEKKLIMDIKKAAKANQIKAAKTMAKDLVRIRKHVEKFAGLTAQLRAIGLQMTSMASTQSIAEAMQKVTKSMTALNRQLNLPALQKVMIEFAKQSELMEMKQEVMNDAVEDVMDNEEDEEESEQIVNQVLDEIGVSINEQMVDTPGNKVEAPVQEEAADKALEARLNNLSKKE